MQGGNLDMEVRIYDRSGSKNTFGEINLVESLFDTAWASIKPLTTIRDNERVLNKTQLIASGVYQFTFRYRTDILPKMIFIDEEDARYEVVSEPIYIGRRKFVAFNCERRNND